MTRKFWNWVRNEEPDSFGSDRTLYLDGEISDETWFGDEVTPKRLNELYATNGQVGFTCTERVDGKLILSEGIKILDMKATSGS